MTTLDFDNFRVDIYVDVHDPNTVIESYVQDMSISTKVIFFIDVDDNGKPKLIYSTTFSDAPSEEINISYVKYLIVIDFLYGDLEDLDVLPKITHHPYYNIAVDYTVNTYNITPEIMNMFRDLDYDNIFVLIDRYHYHNDDDDDNLESDTVVGNVNRNSIIRDVKDIMTQLNTFDYSRSEDDYIVLVIIGIGYD